MDITLGQDGIFENEDGIGHTMQYIYAWVAADDGTGEGIIAFTANGNSMPMVTATPDAAIKLQPLAERTAQATGRPVKLLRFDHRAEVVTIKP
jgi:hypothetical protein